MRATTVVALLVTLLAVAELCMRATRPEKAVDHIGPGLDLYRRLSPDLPPSGAIGFLATTDSVIFNTANYYVAQHALAPRVLLSPYDRTVQFVVTGADARQDIASDPRLHGYELIRSHDRGVKVFRRTSE